MQKLLILGDDELCLGGLSAANQSAHLLHGELNRQVSEGGEFDKAEEGETDRWQEVAKAFEEQAVREARLINIAG